MVQKIWDSRTNHWTPPVPSYRRAPPLYPYAWAVSYLIKNMNHLKAYNDQTFSINDNPTLRGKNAEFGDTITDHKTINTNCTLKLDTKITL